MTFHKLDICNRDKIKAIFEEQRKKGEPITHICHLAARAGVRYSIENPDAYIHSNLQGLIGFFIYIYLYDGGDMLPVVVVVVEQQCS